MVCAASTKAQTDKQWDICTHKTPASPDERIEACRLLLRGSEQAQFPSEISALPRPSQQAEILNNLGVAYLQSGHFDDAVRIFGEGIRLAQTVDGPGHTTLEFMLRGNRAVAFRVSKQWDRALEDNDVMVRVQPNAEHFADRCLTRFNWGQQLDLALADCSEAVRLEPNNEKALQVRGALRLSQKDYAGALADYDALLRAHPSPENLNGRCWTRAVWGQQLDLALADCNSAVRERPEDARKLDSRAFVNFRLGIYPNAVADCAHALAIVSNKPTSLYVCGLAKLRMGDTDGGSADIAAAKKLDPKIADTYAGYGVKP